MRDSEYAKIQAKFEELVKELDLENTLIIDYLYTKGVLSEPDKADLKAKPTNHEKSRLLLTMLRTKKDEAYGFFYEALKENQYHLTTLLKLPGAPRRKAERGTGIGWSKGFEDFTVNELKEWLKPRLEQEGLPNSILEKLSEEKIDGKVFMNISDSELKEVFSNLKFGDRKKLALLRDEVVQICVPSAVDTRPEIPRQQRTEHVRKFGHKPQMTEKYSQNKVLDVHENQPLHSSLDPVHRFFPCIEDDERANICSFVAEETAKFAAACLNERRNGTIHFGISNEENKDFYYGQVLGVPLIKKECEDAVISFLKKCINHDALDAALKCIQVFFIEVIPLDSHENDSHFVCEVDIEPRTEIVHNLNFLLKLNPSEAAEEAFYRLDNGTPILLDYQKILNFPAEKDKLTTERQQQEKVNCSTHQMQNLPQLLKNYLCGGGDKLDGSFCPLLATASVDRTADLEKCFKFVSDVDWHGIFDFDASSEEDGLYQYLDSKEEMLYKVKTVGNFCLSSKSAADGQGTLDEMFQDMSESELNTWIFCNGYQKVKEDELKIAEWKKKRGSGFQEIVRFFRNSIPDERVVMVILVTSKDDVFIEASEELLLSFQDRWLMMAESKPLAEAWIDGLQKRNVEVDPKRCLDNFTFAEVSKAIQQLKGIEAFTSDHCVIKSSSGVEKEIPKKMMQELCDLEIVSATECIVAEGKVNMDELSEKHEEEFFKCNRPTWWNFYFQGHVCKRDKLEDLCACTLDALESDAPDNENVDVVEVYHQPGAGGTTVAMNVIWNLHEKYKSCVIKRITNDTAKQIISLYEHGETNPAHIKPVLIMIDNEDEQIDELKKNIETECQTKGINKLVCVFLICWQRLTLPRDHQARNIFLQQNLSLREKQFFVDKYKELKSKDKANLDNLLGLNIMKEDFNKDYIKRTVAKFVEFHKDPDRKILRFTAVLNCYDLCFRGIPVACFDCLVPPCRGKEPWEKHLSTDPLMMFTTNTRLPGRNKCIRMRSRLLCEYILDEFCQQVEWDSHADLMEEFLTSCVFRTYPRNFAVMELLHIVKECMKKRGMAPNGKMRSKFSPFIQMLCDAEKNDQAIGCIKLVYEITEDAFLAQQIARIYITFKNWDEAERWAKEATLKKPSNSFLWDTHGQIYRFHLNEIRASCEASHEGLSPSEAVKALNYAYTGYQIFEHVAELSKQERNDPPNTSGLFGQMEITLLVCTILMHLPSIAATKDRLLDIFSEKQTLPVELQNPEIKKCLPWLRSLQDAAFICLKMAEDQMLLYQNEFGITHTPTKFFLSTDNIHHFEHRLNDTFSDDDPSLSDPAKMTPEKRRRQMRKLGGSTLYNIRNRCRQGEDGKKRAQEILQLASLNLDQAKWSEQDLTMALAAGLTLICCHGEFPEPQVFERLLKWSSALFEKTKIPEDTEKFINLDPYLFLLVFHWPTTNRRNLSCQCQPSVLKKATEGAQTAFKLYNRRANCSKRNNPIYFLTSDPSGNSCILDKLHLQAHCGRQYERNVSRLLRSPKGVQAVNRFTGVLQKNGTEVKIEIASPNGNKYNLSVPLFIRENSQVMWNKKVWFVLGIGLGGPLACDVSTKPLSAVCMSSQAVAKHDGYSRPVSQRHLPEGMDIDRRIEEVEQQLASLSGAASKAQQVNLREYLKELQKERQEMELNRWL